MAGLGPGVAADAAPAAQRGAYQGVFQMSFGIAALGTLRRHGEPLAGAAP